MSYPSPTPTILLVGSGSSVAGSSYPPLKDEQQIIDAAFRKLGYFRTQVTTGQKLSQILEEYPRKDQVIILHIIGSEQENDDIHALCRALSGFPQLELLFIRGILSVKELQALLESGIPAVAVAEIQEKNFAKSFYRCLAKGKPLFQALPCMAKQGFLWREVSYSIFSGGITWKDYDPNSQEVSPGVFSLEDKRENLTWRAKPPVKIQLSPAGGIFVRFKPLIRTTSYLLAIFLLLGALILLLFLSSKLEAIW